MDAHEVLVAARNLIEREGWHHRTGDRCAALAIRGVDGASSRVTCKAVRELARAIGLPYRWRPGIWVGCWTVGRWNNAPGRTKEEVLTAFDRAISATAPKSDLSFLSNQSDHREVVGSG